MKTSREFDINDLKNALTTDHNGHPIVIKQTDINKLPEIMKTSINFGPDQSTLRTSKSQVSLPNNTKTTWNDVNSKKNNLISHYNLASNEIIET